LTPRRKLPIGFAGRGHRPTVIVWLAVDARAKDASTAAAADASGRDRHRRRALWRRGREGTGAAAILRGA